jgi:hypothetical protein
VSKTVRNSYAEIARARKNSGPMNHSKPSRNKKFNSYCCSECGAEMWDGDSDLCDSCLDAWEDMD